MNAPTNETITTIKIMNTSITSENLLFVILPSCFSGPPLPSKTITSLFLSLEISLNF